MLEDKIVLNVGDRYKPVTFINSVFFTLSLRISRFVKVYNVPNWEKPGDNTFFLVTNPLRLYDNKKITPSFTTGIAKMNSIRALAQITFHMFCVFTQSPLIGNTNSLSVLSRVPRGYRLNH